ncbi:MAG: hypothetical protein Q7U54_08035 [Bacteroidales bacterium]|nr:hypothetical protein [Bacteroidales bacterium]
MNDSDYKQLLAQQVVLLKRIEKLEKSSKGGFRMAPVKSYVEELRKEAEKIISEL